MSTQCPMCNLSPKEFFLKGARLAFGIWLLYVGLKKWFGGPSNFVGYITAEFAKTWSPAILNTGLAWFILVAEVAVALLLLSGLKQRCAWMAASLLMFLLFIGMTILAKPDVIYNFQYFLFCLACAAWSPDSCSSREEAGS